MLPLVPVIATLSSRGVAKKFPAPFGSGDIEVRVRGQKGGVAYNGQ
jgi:hypothetical protein